MLLAGVHDSIPLNQIFWLQFDTDTITSASSFSYIPNPARWTFYNYCGVDSSGHNQDCTSTKAAFPFTPQDAFGTSNGIPASFIDHRRTYYYLTRIAYGFFIVAIVFVFWAFVFSAFSFCSSIGSAIVSFFSGLAFIFAAAAASMDTAAYVKARNNFHKDGINASLGVKMFAFAWTVVALLFLSWLLMTFTCCLGGTRKMRERRERESALASQKQGGWFQKHRKSSSTAVPIDPVAVEAPKSRRGMFNWSRKNENHYDNASDQKQYASSFERSEPPVSNAPAPMFFKTNV